VTAIDCVPAVASNSAAAGVPLVPDVLTVAGLPAVAGVPVPKCRDPVLGVKTLIFVTRLVFIPIRTQKNQYQLI
jgi:hypothetical protein